MTNKMSSYGVWLSYDLDPEANYSSLYTWLDNHDAVECGNSIAFFRYPCNQIEELKDTIFSDLHDSVDLGKNSRLYLVYPTKKNGKIITQGAFIEGGRKKSPPWKGYGEISNVVDGDE